MDKVTVLGAAIAYYQKNEQDYISLTDMVKNFGDDTMIYSWMRNRNTLEFIGIWEELHNPNFNSNEFVTFKSQAGLNSFNLTPRKWIEATHAIGFFSKSGRYGGGTFAHRDIAFEFASWISLLKYLHIEKFDEDRNRHERRCVCCVERSQSGNGDSVCYRESRI